MANKRVKYYAKRYWTSMPMKVLRILSIEVYVKPFDEYGSPIEIVSHFGNKQHYLEAVRKN